MAGRSYLRKGWKCIYFMIEKLWSKKRILEMYLNVAETGKGIFVCRPLQKNILIKMQNI